MRGDVPHCKNRSFCISAVFPACAGMFPPGCGELRCTRCFPRVRGDVPRFNEFAENVKGFSPRARGCSHEDRTLRRGRCVFPACAGMFRGIILLNPPGMRFPRVRGDVPLDPKKLRKTYPFSPRTRGCSYRCGFGRFDEPVFPACAGMFPTGTPPGTPATRFPRVRGDVPEWTGVKKGGRRFSPRARGCSLHDDHPFCVCVVFPACAGMFLPRRGLGLSGSGFPRVRGDVPVTGLPTRLSALFSPRARGCS